MRSNEAKSNEVMIGKDLAASAAFFFLGLRFSGRAEWKTRIGVEFYDRASWGAAVLRPYKLGVWAGGTARKRTRRKGHGVGRSE